MATKKLPADIRAFFVQQGSKGGKLGGRKRMDALTPEERSELAKKAVAAREAKRNNNSKKTSKSGVSQKKSSSRTKTRG